MNKEKLFERMLESENKLLDLARKFDTDVIMYQVYLVKELWDLISDLGLSEEYEKWLSE